MEITAFHECSMIISIVVSMLLMVTTKSSETEVPSPDEALVKLKEGNMRFSASNLKRPRIDAKRMLETAQNGQHPFATVITCSDSRVPVEIIFDQGIGDIFVIRVPGNVCNVDEIGSIEYGVGHLETPVFVALGHSHCGAVTAVAADAELHGSIPKLVANIKTAVKKVRENNPDISGKNLVSEAVKENVWQSIDDLFKGSDVVKKRVKSGVLTVIGAIYDIEKGKVNWLGTHPQQEKLLKYEGSM